VRVDPPAPPRFDEVFTACAPLVWRTMRRLGMNEADAEDLAQEVFVVVHRKLPEFEGRSRLTTWVYGICVKVAADHRRRAVVRHETLADTPPEPAVPPTQGEALARDQARAVLDRVLRGLDDDKRAVFVLYEIEEVPMAEIAEAVGAPLQTVYSRLHAARRLVAEGLAAHTAAGAP
jgi:RNA polymerase sigma-70 factor (ECF subfamily)